MLFISYLLMSFAVEWSRPAGQPKELDLGLNPDWLCQHITLSKAPPLAAVAGCVVRAPPQGLQNGLCGCCLGAAVQG